MKKKKIIYHEKKNIYIFFDAVGCGAGQVLGAGLGAGRAGRAGGRAGRAGRRRGAGLACVGR